MSIDEDKLKRLVDLRGVTLSTALMHGVMELPEKVLFPFSKWLLGGAIAMSFAMLANLHELYQTYGATKCKVVMFLLIVSIIYGVIFSIHGYIHFAIFTDPFGRPFSERLAKELSEQPAEKPDLGTMTIQNLKTSVTMAAMIFKQTKAFWFQLATLLLALSLLLKTFFGFTAA